MDFIRQLVAFARKGSENLTPNAIAIYFRLFMVNNERGREEWFEESDFWLGRAVGIRRRETILSALNLLRQKGFIEFERGGAHKPTRYHIIELSTGLSTDNPQPLNNSANHSANHSAKDSANHSAKDSANHSAKDSAINVFPLINSKKKKVKGKVEGDARARANPKTSPPTLDDVNDFIMERHLHVSARKFFDYYEAGDWKDAKGNPVRNWKQKLMTWEKYEQKPQEGKLDAIDRAIDFFEEGTV